MGDEKENWASIKRDLQETLFRIKIRTPPVVQNTHILPHHLLNQRPVVSLAHPLFIDAGK